MSGSKNCPETPRQKMIGMMYLVLIALLALNVSTEVLEGFTIVNEGLRSSIGTSEMKKDVLYEDFQELYSANPTKVKDWLDKALILQEQSDSLFNYLQNFKYQIVKLADGKDADPQAIDIIAKDNLDVAGQYALVQGNGKKLREELRKYKSMLISLTEGDAAKQKQFERHLFFDADSKEKGWEASLFELMPVSAVVTVLTKFQNDVRSSELDMIQYLKAQTDASDFRVNKIDALVVPNSNYVIKGGMYSAKIILSAVDSTAQPEVFIQNKKLSNNSYELRTDRAGVFDYKGHLLLKTNDGISRKFDFSSSYTVGEPTATISNEDLNVVYRGIDNNFNISVPGVTSENTIVEVVGATCKKNSGYKYTINPTRDEDIKIVVSALLEGKRTQMGAMTYRVKHIPDPKAFLQYRDEGAVTRQVQEGRLAKKTLQSKDFSLIASYGNDELIKANFKIVSFTMTTVYGSVDNQGASLSKRQLSDIMRLKRNDLITFKNIKAVGPDSKVRSLNLLQVEI